MDVPDSDLWERCRAGDAAGLGELFRRHARAVHAHAFRSTGDWSRADDVVSTVFLEAWRRRSVSLPDGMVLAWLYGITTNVVRNEQRSRRRVRNLLARASIREARSWSFDEDEIARRLDDESRASEFLPLVRLLPVREREVVALCWWAELTYEEAAVALGVPVGTVRSRLNRARNRIGTAGMHPALPLPWVPLPQLHLPTP